jgi:hypothetical protein
MWSPRNRQRICCFALALATGGCALPGDPDDVQIGHDGGTESDAVIQDGSSPDMGGPPNNVLLADMARPDCRAQVLAANLQVDWTTPNTLRVSWDRVNPEVPVREYEMLAGRTSVDVEDEVNVRTYTAADNGEFLRTTGEFPVSWTVAWGLEPSRDYFVKLIAYDQDGCHSSSNVASGTTLADVTNEHVIFSESPTAGFSVPAGVTFSNRHPFDGQFHYEWKADCEGEATCSNIIRRGGFAQPIDTWDAAGFETAFLEYAWHHEGSSFAQYPAVRFAVNDPVTDQTEWYKAERSVPTGPAADYRLFQVPLRFFWREGDREPLTADRLDWVVSEFGVAATADDGEFMSWDEVRIRW